MMINSIGNEDRILSKAQIIHNYNKILVLKNIADEGSVFSYS
jgi:hypothetical protein